MSKRSFVLLPICILCSTLLLACNKSDSPSAGGAPGATSSGNTPTSVSSGDKIGVPECDEYLAKLETCVLSKLLDSMKTNFKNGIEMSRKAWREMATDPANKAELVQICKSTKEQAREAYKSYGCDF
ncbi:MAG: hypothetical protein H0U54_03905 [Acidobacteria bacterium]|nr:hypothetical protein [Acidobacteriota bacterium]